MAGLGYAQHPWWEFQRTVFSLTLNNPNRADDVVQSIALVAWTAHVRGSRADLSQLRSAAYRAADERSP